jgi:hypothetical protein
MWAQMLGASHPDPYRLPADLSRHTKNTDPLKRSRGFDPTKHQTSWRTAWRSLRKAAGHQIVETAKTAGARLWGNLWGKRKTQKNRTLSY